jgi:hypothetical protein
MSVHDPYKPPTEERRSSAKLDAKQVEVREKTKKVIAARTRGLTWEGIGEELGISKSWAYKLWLAAIENTPVEGVEEHRALEREKLDARTRHANADIREARIARKELGPVTTKTIARHDHYRKIIADARTELHRITEFRAKLTGALAPTKHQVLGHNEGALEVDIVDPKDVLARMDKIAADISAGVIVAAAAHVAAEEEKAVTPAPSVNGVEPEGEGGGEGPPT